MNQRFKKSNLTQTHQLKPCMKNSSVQISTLDAIQRAATLVAPYAIRTPLLRLNIEDEEREIYLKLENLQPIGVFKVRSMGNVMLSEAKDSLRQGVYTASSGNAGIGLAWMAKKLAVPARVYTPESGPQGKLDSMRSLGASVEVLSDDDWWQVIVNSSNPKDKGFYVDAVRSPAALAGNATMGLEIVEQLPEVDHVIVPFGGGGVACGIASALHALKPGTKMIVAESDTAAPVTAALAAGKPVNVETRPSFISGAGAPIVLQEMWSLVEQLVDSTIVVPAAEVARAVGLLLDKNRVVAEGAGALPVAAALASKLKGKIVCVVTGGNIDRAVLAKILAGEPV